MAHARTSPRRNALAVLGVIAGLALSAPAAAQQINPVYTDDSPVARETLQRVSEFVASRNESEAVRELQKLMDDQPDRLVQVEGQPDLLTSVRSRIHAALLASPRLLEIYRSAETARAQKELDSGNHEAVERSRLLTRPGLEAALRVAQVQLESASFEAARMTLEQLEDHPDRKGTDGGRDAAAMMATIARYLDRTEVRERAERWAKESSAPIAAALPPVERPASLKTPLTTFFRPTPALQIEGVPPKPLWSTPIEPQSLPAEEMAAVTAEAPGMSPDDYAGNLWVLPSVQGDSVYVNDGTFITARDRFTLQPRWSIRPVSEEGAEDPWAARRAALLPRQGRSIEDTSSITVAGRIAIATMGIAQSGDREGDPSTYAVDTATGRIIWSALLHRLDPQLEGASVRGPALIDGGTVILAARKSSQGRRIVSFYLVGLSLDTGKLAWIRPVASAGAIPWGQRESHVGRAAVLDRGIVFCADQLGVLAAVEASTGRPVWVRRWAVPNLGMGGPMSDAGHPWQWNAAIPEGDSIVEMAPDRSEIVRLDRATGAIKGRRPAVSLGGPAYLLRVKDQLAAVANEAVYFLPMADFEKGPAHKTRTFGSPGIRGRVIVSGDRLLIPRSDGVAIIDPAKPVEDAGVIKLERQGNILPLESQLLAIDAASLHSYVTWTVAQRLLQERMNANPGDADPAVTYADLAYRSGHPELIAPAADKALAAIDKAPTAESSRIARVRLFGVLRDMVEYSQEKWLAPTPAAPEKVETQREQPGRQPIRDPRLVRRRPTAPRTPVQDLPVLDAANMALVIERLGRTAHAPDERVTFYMAQGRLHDAQSKYPLAAESYQHILDDAALAAASWRNGNSSVRAELEATRRLRQLVTEHGAAAYGPFEAQATQELAAMGVSPAAKDLERLARRYPAAALAAGVWARIADQQETAGRPQGAVAALREGLIAAETSRAAGAAADPAILGEVSGRLVHRLQKLEQFFAASQLLSRLRTQFPELALTDHGQAIDAPALAADLARRLAGLQRLPRIGPDVRPETQALAGWSILTPKSHEQSYRTCEHVLLINIAESKVALWAIPAAAAADGATGPASTTLLQMLWSREYKTRPPQLLRLDPDSVWLYWDRTDGGDGAVIERISAVGGETRWRTEPFRGLFPSDVDLEKRMRLLGNKISTPIAEPPAYSNTVALTDLLIAMDESVMAVVERSGRAAAFDTATGKLLWHTVTPISQVYDIDVGAGAVVIGGDSAPATDRAAIVGLSPQIAIYDEKSGQSLHAMDNLAGQVRWLRLAPQGEQGALLVAGLAPEVDCFDLGSGKANWSIPGGAGFGSLEGWVFGQRLFLLDDNRALWTAPLATGQLGENALETLDRLGDLSARTPIMATPVGPGLKLAAFATDRGVCVFDASGKLVGMDALDIEEGGLIHPAASEAYFVTVQTSPHQAESGQNLYDLHILDTQSAMLKSTRQLSMELAPSRIQLLDGRVLVSAGSNTVVYSAPEVDR